MATKVAPVTAPQALPVCPLGKTARLRPLGTGTAIYSCELDANESCPEAFSHGTGCFCRALWQLERVPAPPSKAD